jgi:hypothetical protein
MSARMRLRLAAILVGALIGGCGKIGAITQPGAQSGTANFRVYAAMGTSITAGWESGGLVEHHQVHSYAYLFARQAGATAFTIPSVSAPGVPPLLRLLSIDPLVITNIGLGPGTWTNLSQSTAYHNMAVPYALLPDAVDSTNYYNQFPDRNEQFEHIVRHRGTILQQVLSLNPTFVSIEYGSNEVLGAATAGSGTPLLSVGQFTALYSVLLDAIQALAPQTKLALVNVPDVTTIPFVTTFSPITVILATGAPTPLIGPSGPLSPADHVLLSAADSLVNGTGIPVGAYNYLNPSAPGNGRPLLDAQVLSAAEVASIQSAVSGYNDAIRSAATNRGAALVDLNGLLIRASTVGLRSQGHVYTAAFLTGGLFSLDGVHPTDLAHGFIANEMIASVNRTFGASIPPVDLNAAATATASRLQPTRGAKAKPWIRNAGRLCPIPQGGATAPTQ